MARQTAALAKDFGACPFHPDQRLMAEPGRASLRSFDRETAEAGCPSFHARTRTGHPRLHRNRQSRSQALPMDKICRSDPGQHKALLSQNHSDRGAAKRNQTNFGIRTLEWPASSCDVTAINWISFALCLTGEDSSQGLRSPLLNLISLSRFCLPGPCDPGSPSLTYPFSQAGGFPGSHGPGRHHGRRTLKKGYRPTNPRLGGKAHRRRR